MAMYKLYIFVVLFITVAISLFITQPLHAISPNTVISQIQTNSLNGGVVSEELVEIYNNSDTDVDITNWCLKYGAAGSTTPSKTLVCFRHTLPIAGNYVFLPAHSYLVLISNTFKDKYPGFGYDFTFSGGLSDSERWVSIFDSSNHIVDTVQWGDFTHETLSELSTSEAKTAILPNESQLLQRKVLADGRVQDTDNNFNDFESAPARLLYSHGPIYEIEDLCLNMDGIQLVIPNGYTVDTFRNCTLPPVDICSNLDGMQLAIPIGYMIDDNNHCQRDICSNINGLQIALPDNMELNASGECVSSDKCSNLPDVQLDIPDGFKRSTNNDCVISLLPLRITELLPNAVGSDSGSEFIEIYNPNDSDVNLAYYFLYIGSDYIHPYSFPIGAHIGAGQYLAFSNDDIKFTLVNTASSVQLRAIDDSIIDNTLVYENPDNGMAWALIDGLWQYTNQPTPGGVNLPSVVVEINNPPAVESNQVECAANQYRSAETNRCRLIVTSNSVILPCKDGQYRSEETNRCRSIASDVNGLTLCAEGQERNPETNRCRSIAAAVLGDSALSPCKEGQERNPDTNRCRNIASSSMPQADYAPKQTNQAEDNYVLWWSLACLGFVAITYGIWEWRHEIMKLILWLRNRF